jgi:PII-like signaling protein
MQGFQVTFITEENRKHGHRGFAVWLLQVAKSLGIRGYTCVAAYEGYGRDGKVHSAGFIELADRPLEVTMAISTEQTNALFERLENEKANLFYIKVPAEFGTVGGTDG